MNNRTAVIPVFWENRFCQILVSLIVTLSMLTACAGRSAEKSEMPEEAEEELYVEQANTRPEADAAPEPEPTPVPTPDPTPFPMFDIIGNRTIMLSITEEEFIEFADFLQEELDLNDAALAGILANIQCESGFNPNKVGDLGNAYGLCQWRAARLDQMVRFCEENDLNPVTKEGQLRFLAHDLKEVYIYAYDLVRQCSDTMDGALQATYLFCAYYEVPSDPEKESQERQELTRLLIYPRLKELHEDQH